MPNNLYVMEAANLFCGNTSPDVSLHLQLSELKLPGMDQMYVNHDAGGASGRVEVDTIFERLESTFVLAGWSPEVQKLIGAWGANINIFTAYGVIRDRKNGKAMQATAIMGGQLGRADPQNWSRGTLHHWNYAIRGITHYELTMDGQEIYKWDFFTNTFAVGGVDRNQEVNQILGIPSAV